MRLLTLILAFLILTSCNSSQPDKVVRYDYEELLTKKSFELKIIRNEIFARHGYIFKSQDLADYFGKQNWYKPQFDNVDSYLTVDEKEYIEIVLQAENYVKRLESFKDYLAESSETTIGKVELPMKLDFFVESFGKPDSTFIDIDEWCPVGQIHFWNLENENFRFMVLGDKYFEPVSFEAETRMVIFQRIEEIKPSNILTFLNIQLNDTEENVKKEIDNFINSHPDFELDIFESPTLIDRFITKNLGKVYWLTDKQVYFHFVFDKNGKLEYIIEANFNIRTAC